jgi:hypothetical protein
LCRGSGWSAVVASSIRLWTIREITLFSPRSFCMLPEPWVEQNGKIGLIHPEPANQFSICPHSRNKYEKKKIEPFRTSTISAPENTYIQMYFTY